MTTEVWQRVQAIFDRVVSVPPDARAQALAEACGGDAALRAEVESLLEHDARAGEKYLATPIPFPNAKRASDWAERLVGRRIGRYTVERLIGLGGMGSVYEARQERPARTVALKVLQPGLSAPSALVRFRMEPEVLGRLQHPNIAQVFEAGVHEDEQGAVPYFAMEFIAGARPLLEHAAAQELTTRQRLALFAKVCDAVHHGHQKGIIHRDLKPANILVGLDGEPKVIDFGVARATDVDITMTQCTHVGDLVGTVHYMSPEQCDGNPAAIDTRSDIYSLGVVLYELLTGVAPYETGGTTLYAAIRIIREEPPRPPGEVNRRLRGDVEAIVLKALEKDPARRYASAAGLAQDIRRYLSGEPTEARVPTLATRLLRWAVRHPVWVTSAACVLMLGVTGAAVWETYRYTTMRPYRLKVSDDRSVAQLETVAGVVLAEWTGGCEGAIRFADMIRHGATPSGGPLVVLGFMERHETQLTTGGSLAFYDIGRDSKRPFQELRLRESDIPLEEIVRRRGKNERSFAPDRFRVQVALRADVFSDADRPNEEELIAVFSHAETTHAAICIYRLNGTLLYRVWVEADIADVYWMSARRLLVCAGSNGEAPVKERAVDHPPEFGGVHPFVVFAISPELNRITSEYIVQEPGLSAAPAPWLQPVWYHCVQPLARNNLCRLAAYETLKFPTDGAGDSVLFQVLIRPLDWFPQSEGVTRSWVIDGAGRYRDSPKADGYRLYEQSPNNPGSSLPPYESWYLGELPPKKPAAPASAPSSRP